MKPRKLYPRQVETGEWFFLGEYYDHYPAEEVDRENNAYERYLEAKADRLRDEGGD